jgi:hypothetical protein
VIAPALPCDFFSKIQDRYISLYRPRRFRRDVRRRKDVGVQKKEPRKRLQRMTVTGFAHKRRKMLDGDATCSASVVGAPPAGVTVFGTTPATASKIKDACKPLNTPRYLEKMQTLTDKYDKKKEAADALVARSSTAKRQADASDQQKKDALTRRRRAAARLLRPRFRDRVQDTATMTALLKGKPLYLCYNTSVSGRAAPPADYADCTYDRDIMNYVASNRSLARRIILVNSIANPPRAAAVAAHMLGARLQTEYLGVAVPFKAVAKRTFAFTSAARRECLEEVNIIIAASKRTGSMYRIEPLAMVKTAVCKAASTSPKGHHEKKWLVLSYSLDDPELSDLPKVARRIVMTFDAFAASRERVFDT